MQIRDRIKELRRVKASDLLAHPQNWRIHTEQQKHVLNQMLETIGYAGALIGRDTPQGVQLLDGHLRAETTPAMLVPVLIVDLNDTEAKMLLATLDPIAAMADKDAKQLQALLDEVGLAEGEFQAWVSNLGTTLAQDQQQTQVAPYAGEVSTNRQIPASAYTPSPTQAPLTPPSEFAAYDEQIEVEHTCPRCHYQWSGGK